MTAALPEKGGILPDGCSASRAGGGLSILPFLLHRVMHAEKAEGMPATDQRDWVNYHVKAHLRDR
jgi:hypothetical protein